MRRNSSRGSRSLSRQRIKMFSTVMDGLNIFAGSVLENNTYRYFESSLQPLAESWAERETVQASQPGAIASANRQMLSVWGRMGSGRPHYIRNETFVAGNVFQKRITGTPSFQVNCNNCGRICINERCWTTVCSWSTSRHHNQISQEFAFSVSQTHIVFKLSGSGLPRLPFRDLGMVCNSKLVCSHQHLTVYSLLVCKAAIKPHLQ